MDRQMAAYGSRQRKTGSQINVKRSMEKDIQDTCLNKQMRQNKVKKRQEKHFDKNTFHTF